MKKAAILTIITLIHAVASFGLFIYVFSMGMRRFDTGETASLIEKILSTFSTILLYPLVYPLSKWGGKILHSILPGLLGYIPFILFQKNSFNVTGQAEARLRIDSLQEVVGTFLFL